MLSSDHWTNCKVWIKVQQTFVSDGSLLPGVYVGLGNAGGLSQICLNSVLIHWPPYHRVYHPSQPWSDHGSLALPTTWGGQAVLIVPESLIKPPHPFMTTGCSPPSCADVHAEMPPPSFSVEPLMSLLRRGLRLKQGSCICAASRCTR